MQGLQFAGLKVTGFQRVPLHRSVEYVKLQLERNPGAIVSTASDRQGDVLMVSYKNAASKADAQYRTCGDLRLMGLTVEETF